MDELISKHIEIVDNGSGPIAKIIGHRVNVSPIAMYHEEEGWSPKKIAEELPTITLADVHAALAFDYDNPEYRTAEAAAEERFVGEFKRQHPQLVRDELRQRVRG